jgi:hypothetical protein
MNIFEAWAVLEFGVIIIAALISIWRMSVQLKDVMLMGTEKVADWIGRRRTGL